MPSETTPSAVNSNTAHKLANRRSLNRPRFRRWLLIVIMLASATLSFLSFSDLDVASLPRLLLFATSTAIASVSAIKGLKGDIWTMVPGATEIGYILVMSTLLYLWLFVW